MWKRMVGTVAVLTGLLGVATSQSQAGTLDEGLILNASRIVPDLKKAGIKNVGVLPFKIKKGSRQALYAGGPLGVAMPERLENALIMAMEPDETKAIGIIRDTMSTANKGNVGSYTSSKSAFDKLFSLNYRRAWGEGTSRLVKADGFLTGTVSNTGDRSKTTVQINLFTKSSFVKGRIEPVKTWNFTVRTDHQLLADLGYNFSLSNKALARGVKPMRRDQAVQQQVNQQDQQGQQQPQDPLQTNEHSPDNIKGFAFELLYDGVKQTITPISGQQQGSFSPEYQAPPAMPGAKIEMALTRKVGGDNKLGVLLLVNGESTWQMEKGDPEMHLRRWIMGPQHVNARQVWEGMYIDLEGKNLRRWKTLTTEESNAKASELGNRAGWIDIYVFSSGDEPIQPKDQPIMFVSTRGAASASATKSMKSLRANLLRKNNVQLKRDSKGAIVRRDEGGLIYYELEPETSPKIGTDELPNPVLLGHLSIRYWDRPGRVIETSQSDRKKP